MAYLLHIPFVLDAYSFEIRALSMKMLKTSLILFFAIWMARENLFSLTREEVLESVWKNLLSEIVVRYHAHEDLSVLGPSADEIISYGATLSFEQKLSISLWDLLLKIRSHFHQGTQDSYLDTQVISEVTSWLHSKYGLVIHDPLLKRINHLNYGSYESPGRLIFAQKQSELPESFDPNQETSLADLPSYLERKWGGLQRFAKPETLRLSRLGTKDTMSALETLGYDQFFLLNGPYARRGSKTLLAFHSTKEPLVILHSFVNKNLFDHKLMQLRLYYGNSFNDIKVIDSNGFKSWEIADHKVSQAIQSKVMPEIDDLVIGYTDIVESELRKKTNVTDLGEFRLGEEPNDFATVSFLRFKGVHSERTIALLKDVDYRYFGKSLSILVKPFLSKGVKRILFAGSAGSLNRNIPLHALIVPRTFHLYDKHGLASTRVDLDNELFGLFPLGHVYSGAHLSVPSPLVESKLQIDRWREQDILSIDVESSDIAAFVADFNSRNQDRPPVRLGLALVVTDHPMGKSDEETGHGLHHPEFKKKRGTKIRYAGGLQLLWEIPSSGLSASNHMKFINHYYHQRIDEMRQSSIHLALIATDIQARLQSALHSLKLDLRVTHGIIKTYRDLLLRLHRMGISPLSLESFRETIPEYSLPKLPRELQKIILYESLLRSSTLNSGKNLDPKIDLIAAKKEALEKIEKASDYIFSHLDGPLSLKEIEELQTIISPPVNGVAPFKDFMFQSWDGSKRSSLSGLKKFAEWLEKAKPSLSTAWEAYVRFEHLHLSSDGNGRTAELIAQQIALRAGGHPLLFPNRFDIDFILSLRRNGSHSYSDQEFLADMIEKSRAFGEWLQSRIGSPMSGIILDPRTGLVKISMPSGETRFLYSAFQSQEPIKLENEMRVFLDPSLKFENSGILNLRYQKFRKLFLLHPTHEGCANAFRMLQVNPAQDFPSDSSARTE